MPRPRSSHVVAVKSALVARLQSDLASPGRRFLSARALARHFSISYQTAHRLMAELQAEGYLERKTGSGTYLSGQTARLVGVQLIFNSRAKRRNSFGACLQSLLESALAKADIDLVRNWAEPDREVPFRADRFPVSWECRSVVKAAAEARRFALCLNDTAPPGLGGGFVDAVTTDDFSGGACAAELLRQRTGRAGGFAILGGPANDARSQRRIAGFCAHASHTRVVSAGSWFLEQGLERAAEVLEGRPAGVFACNDRLAEAVLVFGRSTARALPPIVGFDNAPIAEQLGLTTIGIPWATLVAEAVKLITSRLAGHAGSARVITLPHEPVLRFTA